jgi:hypothetical protein
MPLVTKEKNYKYEVAFSFLGQDESLAHQLNDLIHDRLSTFIYTEQQKKIVGTDGHDTYTKVFLEEARIVVIIYREEWGTTPFTRIEESAIKLRNSEEGHDFIVIISLDKKKPKWISDLYIWYDFDRWGIKGAATTIENKVREYGGQIREETVADQAARHKREIIREQDLVKYLFSKEGFIDGTNEAKRLLQIAEENILKINDIDVGLNFHVAKHAGAFFISSTEELGLTIRWHSKYINSLHDAYLEVFIATNNYYSRNPQNPGHLFKKEEYLYYLNEAGTKGWMEKKDRQEYRTTEQLINYWQKDFLERARQERLKRNSPLTYY